MHLLQLKALSGKSWAELETDSGVARTMLCDVGNGWRFPGADTAPGLIRLGVSLDDQVRFWISRAEARAERALEQEMRRPARVAGSS